MKYLVIGGQYNYKIYGSTDSLHAAKCLATRNTEYWDNWQGFNRPAIYMAAQVADGIYHPVYTYNRYTRKWEKTDY